MVKYLKHLLRNQKDNDFENWYSALSALALPSSHDDPLFYNKVSLAPYAFLWEKSKTIDFSELIVVYDIKVGKCS